MTNYHIIQGDALSVLRGMESESVQCCVTSPPYYGLRSYKTESQIWDGTADCDHEWGDEIKNPKLDTRPVELKIAQGGQVGTNVASQHWAQGTMGQICGHCGAWRGELGLEPRFQDYVRHILQIMTEVKRVVRPDGCIFINLGDSYSGSNGAGYPITKWNGVYDGESLRNKSGRVDSLQPKSLMNIPHRVFIGMTDELQLIQRNNINWWKRACMPSSAKDRWTVDFESIGFFTKEARYKFNQDLEPLADATIGRNLYPHNGGGDYGVNRTRKPGEFGNPEGRNARTTWDVVYEPSTNDHYAAYPTKLCEKMILAGSDESDTILDPFSGTATTGVTALRHKRNYIGIELQPKYIEISERRLAEVQVKLFS